MWKPKSSSLAECDSSFQATTRHPHRERLWMMIPPHFATGSFVGFHHRRAADSPPQDDQGVFQ